MALKDYESECDIRQKIIVCKDKGNPQQYIAYNDDENEVYEYRIDGYVIKTDDGKKCDFLLWNEEKKNVYFIELKGSDLSKAVEQIEETERVLKERYKVLFRKMNLFYRVVLNRTPTHKLDSSRVKHFKMAHPKQYIFKTNTIEDHI